MDKHPRGGFLFAFNLTAIILILFFAVLIPLLHAADSYEHTVDIRIDQHGTAAVLYMPASFSVDIANGSTTPLNAAEFEIHFDPSALFVTSVTPHTTLCEDRFIITNRINNTNGTILFQCGTITPFSAATGTVATIEAIPLRVGTSSLQFGTTTHVLAHDGYGTNATASTTGLVFKTL